jgi:hypothetical protein
MAGRLPAKVDFNAEVQHLEGEHRAVEKVLHLVFEPAKY